jgi:hypothetical protein
MFYTAEVRYKTLAMIFGIVPSTVSKVITKAEVALQLALIWIWMICLVALVSVSIS